MTTLGLPARPAAAQRPADYWSRSAAGTRSVVVDRLAEDGEAGDLAWLGLVLYLFSAALVALFSIWLFS